MTTTQQAVEALQNRASGTPFVVTPTTRGAQVRWNIADQQWRSLMALNDASRVASAEVVIDEAAGKYSRGVSLHSVDFSRGPLGVEYGRSVQSGEIREVQFHRELGRRTDGGQGVGWSFDTKELTDFVDSTLEPLGLVRRLDRNARIGLYAAAGGIGFAALIGVVLLVVLLLR